MFRVFLKLWIVWLAIPGLALLGAACFPLRPQADIVYSARYYRTGEAPSRYHLWLIDSDGSGKVQLTSGGYDDYSPAWLADGKTILFVREAANTRKICSVGEDGGPVREVGVLPEGFVRLESIAPNRRSIVFFCQAKDSQPKLILFEIATKQQRDLGAGFETGWSPDSQRLYVSTWNNSKPSARIIDPATGNQLRLDGDLRAAAWVDKKTVVAEKFVNYTSTEKARLVIMRADGSIEREVLLPFTRADKSYELSPFADNLFAIPGDPDRIVYGRHAGDSTQGAAQLFYLVGLKGGAPIPVAKGRDLVWSSDKTFLTGDGRHLESLDQKRNVWVSPLSIVSLRDKKKHTLVQGLVSVEGFDSRRRH
ncbi:MAG: hypothetical protein P4L55_15885 [Syntrophobacteraceae bacterium]|nr:hypothetical protein [Syntrophobacteraceae bacterium]